ncbi:MAG TPA: hypothetical protein PKK10_00370 [Woeseiaceae bacterium]|nr:hypothetical protein [Woeseiaceae bacterium]
MAVRKLLMPTAGTWRVVLSRWLLYMIATLPGMASLSRHLNETVGVRPWFQDLTTPLDILSVKFLLAELGEGVALLVAGVIIIFLLQLVWLGGSIRILDPNRPDIRRRLFSHGRPFLGPFLRIAIFAAIALVLVRFGLGKLFGWLGARAETGDWSVYTNFITLNQWRVALLFITFTLIGIVAFWARMMAVIDDRRDTRRLPWQALKLLVRRPVSALLLQFGLVCVVLSTQAIALVCWRQSPSDGLWLGIWALLLLLTAFVWQVRIRAALDVLATP